MCAYICIYIYSYVSHVYIYTYNPIDPSTLYICVYMAVFDSYVELREGN